MLVNPGGVGVVNDGGKVDVELEYVDLDNVEDVQDIGDSMCVYSSPLDGCV